MTRWAWTRWAWTPRAWPPRGAALCVVVLLSGCALPDQGTFAPAPEAKPEPPPPPPTPVKVDPREPLVVIDFIEPNPRYREPLHYAVRAAEARDRRIQYDVVAVVPDLKDPADAQARASEVMRAIMQDGVPASRVHLGLRADPSLTQPQVRVYVR